MLFMTFNLRFENDKDGENSWSDRRDMVVGLINAYAPAVLGTQEGTPAQLDYLQTQLPGYAMNAPDRIADPTCQRPTLFCRRDAVRMTQGGEFWLSETPSVHRSKNWDSAYPRMMSYALCEPFDAPASEASRESTAPGGAFWAVVTHLDNLGVEARLRQSEIIASWVKKRTEPVALMGDFNDAPDSPAHRLLTSPECGLRDAWRTLGKPENGASATHHGFTGKPLGARIDWMLLGPRFRILDAKIIHDNVNGRYPSDHFPYMVECELA
ncbi:MAG: endonuclease/exonuclease/phosphatase family protein [Syntrophobacteraceae bacterium]